ncbi:MAG TPA: STAS domain-containing protein [Actinoplanes sp.]|jgi:anti-anti-sigma factor
MSTDLTFTTTRDPDGSLVVGAAGEIDMSNAAEFAAALEDARRQGDAFVLDLTRVEYLDSAGLAALFPHVDHVHLVAGPLLGPLLTIAGLADVTTIRTE